jgi:hypothetical protein
MIVLCSFFSLSFFLVKYLILLMFVLLCIGQPTIPISYVFTDIPASRMPMIGHRTAFESCGGPILHPEQKS